LWFCTDLTELKQYPLHNNAGLPAAMTTTFPFSVSVNFTLLISSFKWNYTLFVLLYCAYFTLHNVFKVHPCCSVCQDFLPFKDWKISCFIYLSVDGHLSCFHLLSIMDNDAINKDAQICPWVPAFNFLGIYLEVELLDHTVIPFLVFKQPPFSIQYISLLISLHPLKHLYNSDRYRVISHCHFDLNFSNDWWDQASFLVFLGHLCVILLILCQLLIGLIVLFLLSYRCSSYIRDINLM
jgi:hypothetical protein